MSSDKKECIEVIKCFQFESEYERMSSIVRYENVYYILTKGSPEKLKNISKPTSLPPDNTELSYEKKLNFFTKQGFRVISLCYKQIDANSINMNRVELD